MSCYWVASDQPRMIRNRHGEECPGEIPPTPPFAWVECGGCQPCPTPHCLVGWRKPERIPEGFEPCETHAESVCPSCLAITRDHLAEIRRLSSLPLVAEALTKGIDSEAADLLGPAADPKQWRQRGDHGHRYEPDSRVGEQHPLWVLGWFDLIVTEHQGHARTQRITIATASDYLSRNLHFLAADIEFDFADMANTLADCRTHLEQVLHDGEQRETGAPCMTCRVPLELVRGDSDCWRCPRCKEQSTEDQYRFAVMHLHRENAEWLTDKEMQLRTGVKAGTVREWARRELVKRTRDSGRVVYLVDDVERVATEKGMMTA